MIALKLFSGAAGLFLGAVMQFAGEQRTNGEPTGGDPIVIGLRNLV